MSSRIRLRNVSPSPHEIVEAIRLLQRQIDTLNSTVVTANKPVEEEESSFDGSRLTPFTYQYNWLTQIPTEFNPTDHDASKVTSGVFTYARLPISEAQVVSWDTAYASTINGITGAGNGVVAFSRISAANLTIDLSHGHAISEVTNLQAALDAKIPLAQKAAALGVATLDNNAKIELAQIPDSIIGQVEYQGLWDASTNTPTLPLVPTEKGHYYIASAAGTFDSKTYAVGDWIISNGSSWDKVDNTDAVSSVAGKTGVITLATEDIASGVFSYDRLPITAIQTGNWDTAFSWGDHSAVGYLTSLPAHTHGYADLPITASQVSNWDEAYSWGNHTSAGYLTSLPTHSHGYADLPISAIDVANWNEAYSWGDHAQAGYGGGGGGAPPSIAINTAINVGGSNFDAPVTVSAFGFTDDTALRLAVDYRVTGTTTWARTAAIAVTGIGTFNVSVSGLSSSTDYDFRAIATDVLNPSVEIVTAVLTVTTSNVSVNRPVNQTPVDGATGLDLTGVVLASNSFSVSGGSDSHDVSQWQVLDGATIVYDSGETTDKTIETVATTLVSDTNYSWQVRHKGTTLGFSAWSVPTNFTTGHVVTPSNVNPADTETNVGEAPTLESSVFAVDGTDTHTASQWVIARVSDNVVVYDSGEVANLETHAVPAGNLAVSTDYNWKVRHKGAKFGWSGYSTITVFTTASQFSVPHLAITGSVGLQIFNDAGTVIKSSTALSFNGASICEDSTHLYVPYGINKIGKLLKSDLSLVSTYTSAHSSIIACSIMGEDGNLYFAQGGFGDSTFLVGKVNPATMSIINICTISNGINLMDLKYWSGFVYLASWNTRVYRIDPSDMSIVASPVVSTTNLSPNDIVFTSGGQMFVASRYTVVELNPTTLSTIRGSAAISSGDTWVRALALDSSETHLFVSNDDSGTSKKVRLSDLTIVDTVSQSTTNNSFGCNVLNGKVFFSYRLGELQIVDAATFVEIETKTGFSGTLQISKVSV